MATPAQAGFYNSGGFYRVDIPASMTTTGGHYTLSFNHTYGGLPSYWTSVSTTPSLTWTVHDINAGALPDGIEVDAPPVTSQRL